MGDRAERDDFGFRIANLKARRQKSEFGSQEEKIRN